MERLFESFVVYGLMNCIGFMSFDFIRNIHTNFLWFLGIYQNASYVKAEIGMDELQPISSLFGW